MIQIIAGTKGSGKSKQLIEMANESLNKESGFVVFIDDDKRYMYDLKRDVRFVDANDYKAFGGFTPETFLAFICGMLAANFDITLVCVDGLLKLTNSKEADVEAFFTQLADISEKNTCNFVIAMSAEKENLPESVQKYCI